ncbi:hypothetical protein LINPERPRIM_LOCUS40715 [Linum perenne]
MPRFIRWKILPLRTAVTTITMLWLEFG